MDYSRTMASSSLASKSRVSLAGFISNPGLYPSLNTNSISGHEERLCKVSEKAVPDWRPLL